MSKKVYIGKVVSTHGIKGEIKIISDFEYKDRVFVVGNKLIIDNNEYLIKSYRHHKQFDMVMLNDFNNINDVLFLMKKSVYMLDCEIGLDDVVLDEELLDYSVLTVDGKHGIIKEIFWGGVNNKLMRVLLDKEVIIPFNSPMIKSISKDKKEVIVELIEGM